jgi:hypothetical protein
MGTVNTMHAYVSVASFCASMQYTIKEIAVETLLLAEAEEVNTQHQRMSKL